MLCENCQKEIDPDSKFCEFCGQAIKEAELPIKKEPKHISSELASLKAKTFYRFLKVIYILGFCISIFYTSSYALRNISSLNDTMSTECTDYYFDMKPLPASQTRGIIDFSDLDQSIQKINAKSSSCRTSGLAISIFYGIFIFVLYLILTVLVFEVLRQTAYYIFLGKFQESWLTLMLAKIRVFNKILK